MPVTDEHVLLDDNRYIADVVYDFKLSKQKARPLRPLHPPPCGPNPAPAALWLAALCGAAAVAHVATLPAPRCAPGEPQQWQTHSPHPTWPASPLPACLPAAGGRALQAAAEEAHVPRDGRDHHRAQVCQPVVHPGAARLPAGGVGARGLGGWAGRGSLGGSCLPSAAWWGGGVPPGTQTPAWRGAWAWLCSVCSRLLC